LDFEEIQQWFEKLKDLRVLVVGETIIDEYAYCDALGKSGKEPVLNMRHLYEESYLGGVLAIARHLKGLGCKTEILSMLGEKREFEDEILKDLDGIRCHFFPKSNSPTIVKRRYVDQYSRAKLLGVYKINDEQITEEKEAKILTFLQDNIKNYDLVLVGDYGHGFLTTNIIEYITTHANFLALNTQSNSANLGFHTISKYPKADFICIHSGELRQDYRSRFEKTEDLMLDLAKKLQTQRTLITMGKKGLLGFDDDVIESCPAFASKIIDRVGAGDTVLAITSVLSYIKAPLILTLVSGNLAGAFAVSVQGNKSALDSVQILKSLKTLL
jgi:rfaE bifunctional protein kinase chain/domain